MVVATKHNLDPARLVPHSARNVAQLDGFDDSVKMTHGNWRTQKGMLTYFRSSLTHADKVASALHDPSVVPIVHSVFMHSTPAINTSLDA